jgi:hypothetical protein
VADGNDGIVRDLLWPKATDVVWLNFGRATVYRRVVWRTVVRATTRQPLWAGNRESLRRAFLSRHSILLWAHTTFRRHRARYPVLRDDPRYAHLRWHERHSPAEARRFLDARHDGG